MEGNDDVFGYVIGYVWSVTAAAAVFTILGTVRTVYVSGAPSDPLQLIVLTLVAGVIFWMIAFMLALFPVLAMYLIAQRLRIRHVGYYLAGGSLLSCALAALFAHPLPLRDALMFGRFLLSAEPFTYSRQAQQGLKEFLYLSQVMLPASLVGILLFWARVGRWESRD